MKQITAIFHILIFIYILKEKKEIYQPHLTWMENEKKGIEDDIISFSITALKFELPNVSIKFSLPDPLKIRKVRS